MAANPSHRTPPRSTARPPRREERAEHAAVRERAHQRPRPVARCPTDRPVAQADQALTTLREGIFAILSARQIPLSDAARARVLACGDLAVLQGWFVRAATAATAQDVIGD